MTENKQEKKWDYKALSLGAIVLLAVLYNFIGLTYTFLFGVIMFVILLFLYLRDKSKAKNDKQPPI